MENIWQSRQKWSFWLRSCCICRSSVPPVFWLCADCWKKLRGFYLSSEDIVREQEGLTHVRLLDWNRENDLFIRLFLNSLKKGGSSFIFDQIALAFLRRIIQAYPLSLDTNALLIPAPANSQRNFRDHAFCLASAFSRFTGLAIQNPLSRCFSLDQRGQAQKQKDRQERKTVHFYVKGKVNSQKIIFVDDILTTGATAQAAFQALKEPGSFIIFTLAWRSEVFHHQP